MAKVDRQTVIAKAQKHLERGDLKAAIAEYEKLLQGSATDVQLLVRLAGMYLRVGRKNDAVKNFVSAGAHYARAGFFQKAVAVYKQAIQVQDEDPILLKQLADLYQQMALTDNAVKLYAQAAEILADRRRYEQAAEMLEIAIKLDSERPDFKAKLGEFLYQAGRHDEALAIFRGLVTVLEKEGHWEDLARFYERILTMSPDDHEISKDLVSVYLRLGLAPRALQRLKGLYEAGVRDAEVFDLLGRVYVFMGRKQRAVSAYKEKLKRLDAQTQKEEIESTLVRIRKLDPTAAPAPAATQKSKEQQIQELIAAAQADIEAESWQDALDKLSKILQSNPDHIEALEHRVEVYRILDQNKAVVDLMRLSELLQSQGQFDQAQTYLDQANQISDFAAQPEPEEVEIDAEIESEAQENTFFDLAKELGDELAAVSDQISSGAEQAPDFDEIFEAFKQGVKDQIDDQDTDAHYDLGIAYMEMGLIDDAIEEFKLAEKNESKTAEAYNMIALAFSRKGDLERAAEYYQLALEIDGLTPDTVINLQYELSLVLEQLGELPDALQFMQKVVEHDPGFRDAKDCLNRMQERTHQ